MYEVSLYVFDTFWRLQYILSFCVLIYSYSQLLNRKTIYRVNVLLETDDVYSVTIIKIDVQKVKPKV